MLKESVIHDCDNDSVCNYCEKIRVNTNVHHLRLVVIKFIININIKIILIICFN